MNRGVFAGSDRFEPERRYPLVEVYGGEGSGLPS